MSARSGKNEQTQDQEEAACFQVQECQVCKKIKNVMLEYSPKHKTCKPCANFLSKCKKDALNGISHSKVDWWA